MGAGWGVGGWRWELEREGEGGGRAAAVLFVLKRRMMGWKRETEATTARGFELFSLPSSLFPFSGVQQNTNVAGFAALEIRTNEPTRGQRRERERERRS